MVKPYFQGGKTQLQRKSCLHPQSNTLKYQIGQGLNPTHNLRLTNKSPEYAVI